MKRFLILFSLFLTTFVAACQGNPNTPSSLPTATLPAATTAISTSTPVTSTATSAPRTLVICLGQEPQSLYLYADSSVSAWNVLEAIYDGPIDENSYTAQAVILKKIPSLADGDAKITSVSVKAGDEIIDANGDLVTLAQGTKVRPSGCDGSSCATPWDGKSELMMDQLSVSYELRSDIKWSDGQPLTAADSVYSFTLAADKATPSSKYMVNRTASYSAVDTQKVLWVGIPGNLNESFLSNFWTPLPQHLWGTSTAADLVTADESSVKPIGWGPYIIDDWVKGDHITLHKNPNYYRASQGLPYFDTLVYRFVGTDATSGLSALLSGECDIVDRTAGLDSQLATLKELQANNKLKTYVTSGPEVEQITFGIQPSSYDNGYSAVSGDRPNFFGDVRTRQAFAYCMNRQGIVDQLLDDQTQVINTYLPYQNPLYSSSVAQYPFNVDKGAQLLDEVGWKDTDNDPSTPRVAKGIDGIPDGTKLEVNYWTTNASLRKQVADILSQSLAQCGIKVDVKYEDPTTLFASGPDGPVFGRQFDLVDFSWQGSTLPQCYLYQSSDIPDADNHWLGDNISGYSNSKFDDACVTALQSLPGQSQYASSNETAQEIFASELPSIPLYPLIKVVAARPDLCGLTLDPSARSDFWDLESINYGEGCQSK